MSTHEHPAGPERSAGPPALPAAGLRLAAALAARPTVLLRRGGALVVELGRVGLGLSTLGPAGGRADDDRAGGLLGSWVTDPLRRRAVQTCLATVTAATGVLDDTGADTAHLPPADAARLRAVLAGLTGLIPHPAHVPAAGREGPHRGGSTPGPGDPFDTGARDTVSGPVRGRDVAAAPGAVVLRTPVFELLQYLPATEQVHDTPVLVVPPLVHRYWLADLAPGFSLVEHLLRAGLQVFTLSWRPAGPADAGRDLDAHAAAVLDALDACTRITRAPRASLVGVRSGGLLTAAVQAHLAAVGLDDRIAAAAYLATVLDRSDALPGSRPDPAALRRASERATRDGVLDGHEAVRPRAWRRGADRVLPFAVAEHPAGQAPAGSGRAARALRAWAADLLPLPAALHTDLVTLAGAGPDGAAGGTVLGTPVRPAELRRDGYLVAVADDPVRPWSGGHRTARLLGGACRLVLAPGDQAGALIAPPGAGSSFRVGPCDAGGGTPAGWSAAAEQVAGSWWDDLAGWLATRAGTLRDAPPELGGRRLRPLFPAPGTNLGPAAAVPADVRG
ncbi:hypothetical protein ACLFMI_12895 [Pseudonocardia nantongensis]|uniref:hypothetical protein n=1 Tax=Pseudonocardia nantongensis TaxID=1181885 RepID=UPI003978CD59